MKVSHKRILVAGLISAVLIVGVMVGKSPSFQQEEAAAESIKKISAVVSGEAWAQAVAGVAPSEGIRLAKERGEQMCALIRSNPEQAIAEALTLAEWKSLPEEMQAYVEQPFSAIADVEVMIACGNESSETAIMTDLPGIGKMETYVFGRRGEVDSKSGIPVQGIRVGQVGALREEIFQTLDGADLEVAKNLYSVAVADPGGDSVAALAGGRLFYFKNRSALDDANSRLAKLENLPGPNAGAQALFETADAYLLSDGSIDFQALEELAFAASSSWTGSPRDMYVIMVDFSDLPGQPTDPVALSNSLNTTVSGQIWEMSYEKTHIVATVNPGTYRMADVSSSYVDVSGGSYPNAYRMYSNATALVEAEGVDLSPYETVCIFFTNIPGISYAGLANVGGKRMWIRGTTSTKTFTHELGHNYGARHADFWEPTNSNPVDPAGTEIGYGDFTDIMGSGQLPAGHFNAWHKRHINWFDSDNWLAVTNSGTYRVYRSDHRETTGLLRGLEIEKGAGDHYWVGLRQEMTSYETFSRGAYVVWKMAGDSESDLLDMTPASDDGKYDGGLALGQTYSDTVDDVHITPVARGGQTPNQWMDIAVNLGSFSGNSAPTASLSGPTSLGVSESALFTVTASDADGDELAYYWETGDGLVKPNTPSIATAWLSGTTVTVSCVVSDMKGGTVTVSQNVALSSPLDNWTQRTSGTTRHLYDIVANGDDLVAVGNGGTSLISTNGSDWSINTFGGGTINVYAHGVVYNGSDYVAVGQDYNWGLEDWRAVIYSSSDGSTWAKRLDGSMFGIMPLNDVAYGNGIYVAVGDDGTIVRSTNGTTWNSQTSGTTTTLRGVSYGNGVFVAVGALSNGSTPVALTSTNGISWADNSQGIDLDSWKGLYDVQYCNDRFLAGGWYARILSSTDQGQTFSTSMTGDRQVIPAFAFGNGTYFAAGINKDDGNADINLVSLDGVNWSALSTASQDNRNAAVFFNGTFITVGDNGSIWQSDAVTASAGGYASWQLENQGALGFDRDPLDDADFDGVESLVEYALGTSATDDGETPAYSSSATGTYFQLSADRDGIRSDIDYQAERSENLLSNDWNSAETVVVNDTASNLTVRSSIPMAGQTNEFLRLNIELQ